MLLNYTDNKIVGKPIVLLHGMAGSLRYWNNFIPHIPVDRRVIALDLLGFGHSPKPSNVVYDYAVHLQSILETMDYIGITQPFSLVGHSMGALIALRMAATYPNRVNKLLLIGMPIYSSSQNAQADITGNSMIKRFAYYGISSRALCTIWCRILRPISCRIAPMYLPHLSDEAARDSVLHSWQAYSQSLDNIIQNQNVPKDIASYKKPVLLIYGDSDLPLSLSTAKSNNSCKIIILKGGHQIIDEHPEPIVGLLS